MRTLTAGFWTAISVALIVKTPTATLAATTPFTGPQVRLDRGTFVGTRNGSIDSFLGIPFAKPP
jgi:hypothetical protein